VLLSVTFLGERLSLLHWLGVAMVLVGLVLLLWSPGPAPR
jgi:drug/metabolite transporter (DMT)-like permease